MIQAFLANKQELLGARSAQIGRLHRGEAGIAPLSWLDLFREGHFLDKAHAVRLHGLRPIDRDCVCSADLDELRHPGVVETRHSSSTNF
ncbi:hypothetical protein JIR23_25985 [Bradyrhizobium diazoefficiens]|nr:hypothetical protein [Bradyrhizobium diazoefficiens]QQN62963.1 hypothetical protein JIR23_25985 [Bradyrhizobium diazoefficiens]